MDAWLDTTVDICVVGGGIVGLAFAKLIQQLCPALSLIVLDDSQTADEGKSIVINAAAAAVLETLSALPKDSRPISQARVRFAGAFGGGVLDDNESALGYGIDYQTVRTLLQDGITIHPTRAAKVSPSAALITTCGQTIQPRLLVMSVATPALPQPFTQRRYRYRQTILSFTADIRGLPQGVACQRFTQKGIAVLVPRPDDKTGVILCAPPTIAARLNMLSDEALSEYLSAEFALPVKASGKRFAYTPQLIQTRPLADRQLALIGQAATTIHPIGAQGISLGIKDAKRLATLCATDGIETVSEKYSQQRRTAHCVAVAKTHSLALGAQLRAAPFRLLGGGVAGLLTKPPAKQFLLSVMQ